MYYTTIANQPDYGHALQIIPDCTHCSGGTALIAGFIAMLYTKGGPRHRITGKLFFWGMTASCSSALYLGIAHPNPFLLMVAFFSYQLVAIGYRILYLKKLFTGTLKLQAIDWLIGIVPAIFNVSILIWGVYNILHHQYFGITGIAFGSIGIAYSYNWLKGFYTAPKEKQHWLFTHFQGFGAAYIAATTAFMAVNITFLPSLLVWLSPSAVGTVMITLTTIKYKKKFAKKEIVKHINE